MRPGLNTFLRSTALLCLLLGCAALLAGCCTILRKCPPKIDLRLEAGDQLNSCTDQGSYQVMVRIYSLAAAGPFQAAEFEDLWFQESKLGETVLEVLKLTVAPGQTQTHRWQRPAGTRAIGVVANFCRLDAGCWKQVLELADGSQQVDLSLAGTCLTFAVRP